MGNLPYFLLSIYRYLSLKPGKFQIDSGTSLTTHVKLAHINTRVIDCVSVVRLGFFIEVPHMRKEIKATGRWPSAFTFSQCFKTLTNSNRIAGVFKITFQSGMRWKFICVFTLHWQLYKPIRQCSGLYNLRKREFVQPRFSSVTYGKHSLRYLGPKLWNDLTPRLRNLPSLKQFKNVIRDRDLTALAANVSDCRGCNLCQEWLAANITWHNFYF